MLQRFVLHVNGNKKTRGNACLRKLLERNGDKVKKVFHRVVSRWENWEEVFGVLCHSGKSNTGVGLRRRDMSKAYEFKLEVAEMRIPRWV